MPSSMAFLVIGLDHARSNNSRRVSRQGSVLLNAMPHPIAAEQSKGRHTQHAPARPCFEASNGEKVQAFAPGGALAVRGRKRLYGRAVSGA